MQDMINKFFPYWNVPKLQRIIRRLTEKGGIIVGNFNSMKMDKTKWYRPAHWPSSMDSDAKDNSIVDDLPF